MATEYDLYHHPQLNPVVQQKMSNSILRISRLCWKMCYRDKEMNVECPRDCTQNYIETFDLVLEELRNHAKDS